MKIEAGSRTTSAEDDDGQQAAAKPEALGDGAGQASPSREPPRFEPA